MSRTNKIGILKKKLQQAKQKKIIGLTETDSLLTVKKDFTNPKSNTYTRFLRGSKFICDKTSFREDPDGFRIIRKSNGGEIEFKFEGENAWGYRRWRRKIRKM